MSKPKINPVKVLEQQRIQTDKNKVKVVMLKQRTVSCWLLFQEDSETPTAADSLGRAFSFQK